MEDIKKLLERNDYLMSSSDDNETDNESLSVFNLEKRNDELLLEINCLNSITKKRNGKKRLPTRRPDPNVYNRNALLARENRRKKKVYLETIEKELQIARKANRVLAKALKHQLKVVKRLEQEKKYLEGLIANQSEILTLVNALNFRSIPESESDKSPFSSMCSNADYTTNGIKDRPSTTSLNGSLNDTDSLSKQFNSIYDDLENDTEKSFPNTSTNWNDIWAENDYHIDNLIIPESAFIQNKEGHYFGSSRCCGMCLRLVYISHDM